MSEKVEPLTEEDWDGLSEAIKKAREESNPIALRDRAEKAEVLLVEVAKMLGNRAARGREIVDAAANILVELTETQGKHLSALEREKALREAAKELLEVADLRGDSDLPHPSNEDALWTARMQQAWDEMRLLLTTEPRAALSTAPGDS